MPRVPFDQLPDTARVWIFGCDRPIHREAPALLEEVDQFLDQWAAHGKPLRCAREWREDRLLVIGVDPTHEQASGCSIDGLFRRLQALEGPLATSLLAGGRVFYRDANGRAQVAPRGDVGRLAAAGEVSPDTTVFDTTLTDAGSYRARFERPARETWVGPLMGNRAAQDNQSSIRVATKSSSVRNG